MEVVVVVVEVDGRRALHQLRHARGVIVSGKGIGAARQRILDAIGIGLRLSPSQRGRAKQGEERREFHIAALRVGEFFR